MKRILVIDESEVIRETLALILGHEFTVIKRSITAGALPTADVEQNVDLMILGVSPKARSDAGSLLSFASQVPYAVLFLVDNRATSEIIAQQGDVDCLVKPFNPYELKRKVGMLLARQSVRSEKPGSSEIRTEQFSRYLTFPFLTRTAAVLVHRFSTTQLPVLVWGEIGCGQERVIRGMRITDNSSVPYAVVNGREVNLERLREKVWHLRQTEHVATLVIEDVDKVSVSGQSALLSVVEELQARLSIFRLLTTSKADLLERVYDGEFLEALYYKLATLTLKLPPLRERSAEIPEIASWFADQYGEKLGLRHVTLEPNAFERLSNYMWFGNLNELESVIARTLTVRRKAKIEAEDLIFDFPAGKEFPQVSSSEELPLGKLPPTEASADSSQDLGVSRGSNPHSNGKASELKNLIHELAHEMKNPMVTIKTFAQLLGDRYQDENFRARFQDVVGGDIERIDDLLEVMIEFADFSQPQPNRVLLEEQLRATVNELGEQCAKRQTVVRWSGNRSDRQILADENQLSYVLRNVMLAILSQVKMGTEVDFDTEPDGSVVISYFREGARMASITQYLSPPSHGTEEITLPLRILLSKELVERNGGGLAIGRAEGEREIVRMEFPVA
jgi:DNA-binding NtrC family response regulator